MLSRVVCELGLTCELLPVHGKAGIRREREEQNANSFAKTFNWFPQKKILVHAILEMKKYNTLYHRQFPTGMFNLRPTGLMHSSTAMNVPNAKS